MLDKGFFGYFLLFCSRAIYFSRAVYCSRGVFILPLRFFFKPPLLLFFSKSLRLFPPLLFPPFLCCLLCKSSCFFSAPLLYLIPLIWLLRRMALPLLFFNILLILSIFLGFLACLFTLFLF